MDRVFFNGKIYVEREHFEQAMLVQTIASSASAATAKCWRQLPTAARGLTSRAAPWFPALTTATFTS